MTCSPPQRGRESCSRNGTLGHPRPRGSTSQHDATDGPRVIDGDIGPIDRSFDEICLGVGHGVEDEVVPCRRLPTQRREERETGLDRGPVQLAGMRAPIVTAVDLDREERRRGRGSGGPGSTPSSSRRTARIRPPSFGDDVTGLDADLAGWRSSVDRRHPDARVDTLL